MTECKCGAVVLEARAPSGRHVALEVDQTWVQDGAPWPDGRLFTPVHKPVLEHPEPYYAKPVSDFMDRASSGKSGPFNREHVCPA